MKEITKRVICFTDIGRKIECEKLLDDLTAISVSLDACGTNPTQYRLAYCLHFDTRLYGVSKEDYEWCLDYLENKVAKND